MARWGWGDGAKSMGPVDHVDVLECRVYDGDTLLLDWIDFVDEEANQYRVLVTDPPGAYPPLSENAGRRQWKLDERGDEVLKELRTVKGPLRVVPPEQPLPTGNAVLDETAD